MSRRKTPTLSLTAPQVLLGEIRALIESARQRTTAMVNSELTMLFWRIGRCIHTEVLAGERAEYGEVIVAALAAQLLARDYGRSFAEKNLRRMVQFAAAFSEEPIVVTLSRQLNWSHFVALLPLKDPLQREYYTQMCCAERWSVRTLRGRVDSMLYERTALSRQPNALIAQELLRDTWQEKRYRTGCACRYKTHVLEMRETRKMPFVLRLRIRQQGRSAMADGG